MTSSTRRRDAVANRQALLDAAAELLRQDPQASIDAIATAAGLTRRAVYGHFPSRDALLEELLERGAARISGTLDGIRHDDPATQIAILASAIWRAIADIKLVVQMLVHGPFERLVGDAIAPVRRALLDAVERGAADGSFRQDQDPSLTSLLIERTALAMLDVAVARRLDDEQAQRMLAASALGIAGLDWRAALHTVDSLATYSSENPSNGEAS
ncbi:MAG TPA: TetR/AcrR family transcriptional regulator [Microbacterium sp.]|nr:TetR/AcrR family transcriptional regulator [Microbacterium sp.]